MKITDNSNEQILTFDDMNVGQVFKSFSTGFFYIKTDDIEDVIHGVIRNAVDLSNGKSAFLVGCERVIAVNAELVIT